MGKLPIELQDIFNANPRFIGYKFPDISKPDSIEKKYIGKMS
jgi:cyclin-dependent kinase-like